MRRERRREGEGRGRRQREGSLVGARRDPQERGTGAVHLLSLD